MSNSLDIRRAGRRSIRIDRPIFIVGPHRSGTTLLYRELVKHRQIGFLNLANRRVRFSPRLAHAIGRIFPRVRVRPMEAPRFWDRYRPRDDDVMDEDDAPPRVVNWYRKRISLVLALRGVPRFLAKYPRLSLRLRWLETVFPDAMFIHMTRDWRAVVSSTVERMTRRKHREKWFGIRIPGWSGMRDLPPSEAAGRIYRVVARELSDQGERLGDRCLTVSYEALCRDPHATLEGIVAWGDLPPDPEFARAEPPTFECMNWKWPARLSPDEIDRVRDLDPELFSRHEAEATTRRSPISRT